jgi:hypothetical protein
MIMGISDFISVSCTVGLVVTEIDQNKILLTIFSIKPQHQPDSVSME